MTGRGVPAGVRAARRPVATIALAQLLGTSLWFSANSAADDLTRAWGASVSDIGLLTGAVQFGFILGTLTFAVTGFADRFAASRIFAACAVLGAAFNAAFALAADGLASGAALRFAVGLCLAGIYPLGMKLIIGWAPERAGTALSTLVGMLTLGTALPHALRAAGAALPWQPIIVASSVLALAAAALVRRLGDGPHAKRSAALRSRGLARAFRAPALRASALGYFGHMWELYAFWTLVPTFVARVVAGAPGPAGSPAGSPAATSGASFAIIAIGAASCVAGGIASRRVGSVAVAAAALAGSAACCALFAAWGERLPPAAALALLLAWGATVVADSPHFSALSAAAAPPELVGSVLAIQNSIGFAITVASIALATALVGQWGTQVAWLLLPGPVLGLAGLRALFARPR